MNLFILFNIAMCSPIKSYNMVALEQVVAETMMNMDVVMAAFATIEAESIIQSATHQQQFSPKKINRRTQRGGKRFWKSF